MPRPQVDKDEIKSRIIAEAEHMLASSDGKRLILSEIASRLDMSQSYVHVFFPTKADLIRVLAQKWFARVEEISRAEARSSAPPAEKLERWLLGILREKRGRFDQNPVLFRAYLALAQDHMDLVAKHVSALQSDLKLIVLEAVGEDDADKTLCLVEDCTLLFRTPQNIAQYRKTATDVRARAVCRLIAAGW